MAIITNQNEEDEMARKFGLSARGAHGLATAPPFEKFEKLLAHAWTPENPDGIIALMSAENSLMHGEVARFLERDSVRAVEPAHHLTYGTGPRGSYRLRKALASFFNSNFGAADNGGQAVDYSEILVLAGASSAVDAVVWSVCAEGEGVLASMPLYTGFDGDVAGRNAARLLPVPFEGIDGYRGLDDAFEPRVTRLAYERAYEKAVREGVMPRAVLFVNPHNPLGRCYPVETIKEIAAFCGRHGLHLISDEIYAKSIFNPDAPGAVPFRSVLALSRELAGLVDPKLVHVVYGASKDFCANGMRLGVLRTTNRGLLGAVSNCSMYSWPPYLVQDMWAAMLEDEQWMSSFFALNHKRMKECFALTTAFFDAHGIPYYAGTHAAGFLWFDLRRFMFPASSSGGAGSGGEAESGPVREPEPDYSPLKLTAPDADEAQLKVYRDREAKIMELCIRNGVLVAPGTSFFTEQLGFFRISFTVRQDELREGLERLLRAARQAQAGWSD